MVNQIPVISPFTHFGVTFPSTQQFGLSSPLLIQHDPAPVQIVSYWFKSVPTGYEPALRHASQRNRLPGREGRQAVKDNDEANGCKQEANEGLLKRVEARYVAWLLAEL